MNSNFEPPRQKWAFPVYVGAILTAVGAIAGLELWSSQLSKQLTVSPPQVSPASPNPNATASPLLDRIAKLDTESMQLPGTAVTPAELAATKTPYIPASTQPLTPTELAMAKQAWQYFQTNWNQATGLVNSADGFASVTLWDQSAAMAALVSAKELNLIPEAEFKTKMSRMLQTLAKLPLYKNELPNKVYNSRTLVPVNYGQLEKREEIGWSAIDVGRMALWLKIVGSRYPEFKQATETVWKSWNTKRLTKDGQMYGTKVVNGKEEYNQEGRLGYESYAAYGLKLWGLDVSKALDVSANLEFVNLYGQGIPYDRRDAKTLGANNYVLSEPYFLDGIETGFQSLPKAYSDRLLAAQVARYQATKKLTALTEDNLDRPPYFVYNTLFVNGQPWATINDRGETHNNLRFISAKAAIGWYVIYQTDYTRQLFDFVNQNLRSDRGWYNGFYESLPEPNKALTANNNGIILESLLYKQVGKPLLVWATAK
jgi:hypothetical protein